MDITPKKIIALCDSWYESVQSPDGGTCIGKDSDRYRLFNNGVHFHNLSVDELKASIVGLTVIHLLPHANRISYTIPEHSHLWAWCAEIIMNEDSDIFSHEEYELQSLFEACIRASLAKCNKPVSSREEFQKLVQQDRLTPHNVKNFSSHSSLILSYLTFPLLEGICKKLCNDFILMDGRIIQEFAVPRRYAKDTLYTPKPRRNKERLEKNKCSSLRDLLIFTMNHPSSENIQDEINKIKSYLYKVDSQTDPFDLIYDWRNQSLHGSTNFMTIGGTLLNLALLLLINQTSGRYEQLRKSTVDQLDDLREMGHAPWVYYPPY